MAEAILDEKIEQDGLAIIPRDGGQWYREVAPNVHRQLAQNVEINGEVIYTSFPIISIEILSETQLELRVLAWNGEVEGTDVMWSEHGTWKMSGCPIWDDEYDPI